MADLLLNWTTSDESADESRMIKLAKGERLIAIGMAVMGTVGSVLIGAFLRTRSIKSISVEPNQSIILRTNGIWKKENTHKYPMGVLYIERPWEALNSRNYH